MGVSQQLRAELTHDQENVAAELSLLIVQGLDRLMVLPQVAAVLELHRTIEELELIVMHHSCSKVADRVARETREGA